MTLRISLRDGEQVIVNGAMIRSVGRTSLCVENQAAVLRGRDLMRAEEATTPARRLYFACITAYLEPAVGVEHHDAIIAALREAVAGATTPIAQAACAAFAHRVATGEYYRALGECRVLMRLEAAAAAASTAYGSGIGL